MATINVDGSAARLLANGVLAKSGYCLYYCWLAISQGVVHYITGGADTAYNTWLAVPADHQHASRAVPKDFPAFLGKKFSSSAGDVIISRGDGTFVATDWPGSRQVGICTLAERETQTGRQFVGWASSMGGHELVSTSTAGESGTPITAVPENHLPEYGGARVALVMNRTQDNVLAIYDESHWQEFAYTSNMQPTTSVKQYQIDFAIGQSHALPNVPYDPYAWDLRSNKNAASKRALFTDTGSAIVPIVQSSLTDVQVKAIAAAIVIPAGASRDEVVAAVRVGSDAVIAKIPTKLS